MDAMTRRQRYLQRHSSLKTERSSWEPQWREIAENIRPWRAKFLPTDRNRGTKQHQHIINGTPTWASRVLASGMMAGISSPARPWFRLGLPDPDLADFGAVKAWLHIVEDLIRQALSRSNLYNGLHGCYENLGDFGITALHVEEDPRDKVRGYLFPLGRYCLANSARLTIDTCYRELGMTVGQLVERFGLQKCSTRVKTAFAEKRLDEWVEVLHVIEPNRDVKPGLAGPEGMEWKSCWMEVGAEEGAGFLLESGFREFPVMAPRWNVSGEDVYGSSPGMEALGDAKALQVLERRKAQTVDKIVTPPMRGPGSLRAQKASLLPGEITYSDSAVPGQVFEPVLNIHPSAVTVTDAAIREHEHRIKTAFYADLWLALTQTDGTMTAREVAERHEEKMLMLGPVMERLEDELLDPLISRVFGILLRAGMLPPPPPELEGMEMRVEYISILAQAQKMLGITQVERLATFTASLATGKPEVLDKLNLDKMVDSYAGMLGTEPQLVRSEEEVQAIRAERAKLQQAQAAAEMGLQVAQGAKVLSETSTDGDNALTRMLGGMGVGPRGVA